MTGNVLRCVVADDHPAIVDAISRYFDEVDGIEIVGRASDGEAALEAIERAEPDVALLDVRMPRLNGIDVVRRLTDGKAKTAAILYTGEGDRALLIEALDIGARGFVLKDGPLSDLARAIRLVADGGTYVDPALASTVAGPNAAARLHSLTKREREILRMLADGMRNEQVAAQLFISPLTVRTHVKKAMEKLEADTRTQAVARALRESLIS